MTCRKFNNYDHGHWALQRERFQIDSDETPRAPSRMESSADIVMRVMQQFGLESRTWEERLVNEWVDIVGAQIARHARPGRMSNATLYIYVTHSIWLDEITRYSKDDILQRLQERFGKKAIREIKVALDPDLAG